MSERRCGYQVQRDARLLIRLMCETQPFGTLVRLEALYQHYARFEVMAGNAPVLRRLWLQMVFNQDPIFAAGVITDPESFLEDMEGIQL